MRYEKWGSFVKGGRLYEYISWPEGKKGAKTYHKKSRVSEVQGTTRAAKDEAKELAHAWLREENERLEAAERRGPEAEGMRAGTVAAYVSKAIDSMLAGGEIEPSTGRSYRDASKRIVAAFSDVPLAELTATQVEEWRDELLVSGGRDGKGLSTATVGKAMSVLTLCLNRAVSRGVLDSNPAESVKRPKLRQKNQAPNALDPEARDRLLAALDEKDHPDGPGAPARYTVISAAARIALFTGMRSGEVCGLQWRDLQVRQTPRGPEPVIIVSRSIGRDGRGGTYVKEPKTGHRRAVAVPASLAAFLEDFRASRAAELGRMPAPGDYVLSLTGEGHVSPVYVTHRWEALARRLDLRGTEGTVATFHDLRHTWATLAIAAGAPTKVVQNNLGHASPVMTLRTYVTVDADSQSRVAQLTDQYMRPAALPEFEIEGE